MFQIKPIDENRFELSVKQGLLSKLGIKKDDFNYSNTHKFGELIDIGLGILKIEKTTDFPNNIYYFKSYP